MQALEKISNRFWYQTPVSETDRPILGVVIGDKRSLMIDAGNSEAHAKYFLSELEKNHIPQPSLVVLTHWHWDHTFGLSALDMISVASKQTKDELEKLVSFEWSDAALDERVKSGVEIEFCANAIKEEFGSERNITIKLPEVTFEKRMDIDLGGVTCQIHHVGGDHAQDSVIVYIKEEKILFLADAIYANLYASKRNMTVKRTLQLLDKIAQFDAETYILSHWKPVSKHEYQQEAKLLRNLAHLTEQYEGRYDEIKIAYQSIVNRDLNEDELETLDYFVNGFELGE
ncbi:MBL fold metallo-hydrolase [Bacillus sp. DTU_2020_1000418_1_SI_GHA_SEK_038]|uniref:MBL fold metallo-hydrolase n=1 Tax=Bacillus sp. DTU_2020_1000418_1_SI_GHA_SEK_038 TaxID=3077585 RepID=UPI0028E7571E|nr:MBL fold metallo-hydrolase [Bacillus sp. DTU_2020_1000418_1_SI_GHA_SEK_038]WNS73707.1 MBL fold metallo-hydrolase [Bacillus sp. DTU_2020_1000418_1_SI_GHA_SEK_038]